MTKSKERCPRCKSNRFKLLATGLYWCGYCSFEFLKPIIVGNKDVE